LTDPPRAGARLSVADSRNSATGQPAARACAEAALHRRGESLRSKPDCSVNAETTSTLKKILPVNFRDRNEDLEGSLRVESHARDGSAGIFCIASYQQMAFSPSDLKRQLSLALNAHSIIAQLYSCEIPSLDSPDNLLRPSDNSPSSISPETQGISADDAFTSPHVNDSRGLRSTSRDTPPLILAIFPGYSPHQRRRIVGQPQQIVLANQEHVRSCRDRRPPKSELL